MMASMTSELSSADALGLRLASLQLVASGAVPVPGSAAEVVTWFGAMQGQDLASLQWSLGLRLPGSTLRDVEAELEGGSVLRTWPMRGTIHLVPAQDARWMLSVLGEKPLGGAAKRREYLGLSTADADRAVEVLGGALAGGGRLTRAECIALLVAGGVDAAGQRGYHLLWYASQRGVTCIGPNVDGEQTFVLLDEWAPDQRDLSRDEALATIALRYFRSHGPTTRQDFAGWAGITARDAKVGIAGCGGDLVSVPVDGVEMVAAAEVGDAVGGLVGGGSGGGGSGGAARDWLTLPGFDEYLLGFKDRSLMADAETMAAVIPGGNGIFRATIVRGGRVLGTWKRTIGAKVVTIEVLPLVKLTKADRGRVDAAFAPYGRFLAREVSVRWP